MENKELFRNAIIKAGLYDSENYLHKLVLFAPDNVVRAYMGLEFEPLGRSVNPYIVDDEMTKIKQRAIETLGNELVDELIASKDDDRALVLLYYKIRMDDENKLLVAFDDGGEL